MTKLDPSDYEYYYGVAVVPTSTKPISVLIRRLPGTVLMEALYNTHTEMEESIFNPGARWLWTRDFYDVEFRRPTSLQELKSKFSEMFTRYPKRPGYDPMSESLISMAKAIKIDL